MKFKETISDIWDNLVYYTKYKPMDIYKTVRSWWRCNAKNPYHWKLIWFTTFHHYGWDNSFNWEVIQLMIQKSKYYFETHQYASDEKRSEVIRWQSIAINLLDIILEKKELWDWNYDEKNYECFVKVNLKNKERFAIKYINYETGEVGFSSEWFESEPHELYKEKAKKLLLQILDVHSDTWRD